MCLGVTIQVNKASMGREREGREERTEKKRRRKKYTYAKEGRNQQKTNVLPAPI